jgi:hypothetical protein
VSAADEVERQRLVRQNANAYKRLGGLVVVTEGQRAVAAGVQSEIDARTARIIELDTQRVVEKLEAVKHDGPTQYMRTSDGRIKPVPKFEF